LGSNAEQLKNLVREGKLREFRDAGSVNYKVGDVDKIAAANPIEATASMTGSSMGASASASGEIILEPVEDSGIELAPSASDVLTLEGSDAADTSPGLRAKEGSSVPSVGINVFDDDELDEHVDPLAQTAVSDVAGLGIAGAGSGSGILDLSRESDDTSLGAELLDEIYTSDDDDEAKSDSGVEVGEDTRAGLDDAIPEEVAAGSGGFDAGADDSTPMEAGAASVTVTTVVEHGPDAVSSGLTAALGVAVMVIWIGGLGAAAMVRGSVPSILQLLYENLMIFAGGSLLAGAVAGGVAYFLAKRSA
jgi:hypothetical protein